MNVSFWRPRFNSHTSRNKEWITYIVVQSLSHVWLFVTPWTAAHQALLSFTVTCSFLRFMSIELVILSNHLILCIIYTHIHLYIVVYTYAHIYIYIYTYWGRWEYKSLSKAWRKWNEMSQLIKWGKGEKKRDFFFLLSDLFGTSLCWVMPAHTGEGNSLYWVIDSNDSLIWKHPHSHIQ